MSTVLAAIEADACARPVLETAIALAEVFDATVAGLHVLGHGAASPRELASHCGVELREVSGSAVEQIVAAACQPDTVALVLGARGVHGGPQPAGHTALELITRLRKPVAVVPPHARPPQHVARLLLPLEGTPQSSRALEETIKLAHRRQLEILVLHVHSPATVPAFSNHDPHATQAWEQEFLARYISTPHQRVKLLRRLGVPADDIVAVAHESTADLVVLAWSQDLSRGRALVVSEALARSDIPVLLLPAQ
jgi:nucleotide-binding universal stress UspA family protein